MITLFTGVPGSGKTAALVEVVAKLAKDRPLYAFGLDGLQLEHGKFDPTRWHEELPEGAVAIIDEVQDVWRPRGAGAGVPEAVKALEVHRHRGIDFFLTTQKPHLLDSNVRALVGRHVHLRDLGLLGRRWLEWDECCWPISTKRAFVNKRWKLPKASFALYKSASLHTKAPRSAPPMLFVAVGAFLLFALLAWRIGSGLWEKTHPGGPQALPAASLASGGPASGPLPRRPARKTAKDYYAERNPVLRSEPLTAPMYDAMRQVVRMPRVMGGFCQEGVGCRCYVQDGLRAVISAAACEEWVRDPPFDPYYMPAEPGPQRRYSGPSTPAAAAPPTGFASSPAT